MGTKGSKPAPPAEEPSAEQTLRRHLTATRAQADADATLAHALPHAVVSQVLRPGVAALLPPSAVRMETALDVQRCVTALNPMDIRRPDTLAFAATLPLLTTLDLSRCDVDITAVSHVAQATQLRSLDLAHCSSLTAASFERLAGLQGLTSLNLWNCSTLGREGLQHVTKLVNLTSLDLSACKEAVDDGSLRYVATSLLRLRTLSLSCNAVVSPAGLRCIAHLPELTSLDLGCCPGVDATALRHVSRLRSLEWLSLWSCCYVDMVGLAHLTSLSRLTFLDLRACQRVDAAAAAKAFSAVKTLRLPDHD